MNTIDIKYTYKTHFLKYLGYKLHTQPHLNDVKRFCAQIDMDDDNDDFDNCRTCFLTPWIGTHHWQYNGETLLICVQEEGSPKFTGCGIDYFHRIQVSHPSVAVLSEFIKEALTYTKPIKNKQIQIYYSKSKGYWEHFNNIYAQPLDRVYIEPMVKDNIISHIDSFIASKDRYLSFGRPYKLNFLLTGVPGAGKTSLVKAIALKYNRPLYVLSFTKGITDESLIDLMSEVNNNSIILVEDIDAFFVDRESKANINVSFSALLNVMDGTMMKGNGTMMFLTANHPDRLDSALIRPGRVDHVIRFDYPRQQEVKEAFHDITNVMDDKAFASFYQKIKCVRINMSSVVDFLFRYSSTYMDHIDKLLAQNQIRQEMTSDKTDKMYM